MTSVKPDRADRGAPADSPQAGKANYVTGIADGNLAQEVKLRDFLFGIGVVFRLEKRRKAKPAKTGEKTNLVSKIPFRIIGAALAPIALGAIAYLGYQQWSGVPMPPAVVGTWSTSDGRYAGRSFWLNPAAVAFQNGKSAAEFSIHPITRVTTREKGDTTLVDVKYEQEGQPITFSISYVDSRGPEIRMTNQPNIRWIRSGEAPAVRVD